MSTCKETIILYSTASEETQATPEFKVARSQFAEKCKQSISSFVGTITKQYESVSPSVALAATYGMAFGDNNFWGMLYYGLLDPVNKMGNVSMANGVKEIAAEVFGVDVGLKKKSSLKEGDIPYYNKNFKTDPEKGTKHPKDMDKDIMISYIEQLEAGGFKELLTKKREEKEKEKDNNGSGEVKLTLTKMKANPNANKAIEIATKLMKMQDLVGNIDDLRIHKLVNKLDAVMIEVNETYTAILESVEKEQIGELLSPTGQSSN